MKSAYIFSGIDGLDSMKDRIHVLTLPAVADRIVQAQKIIDRVTPNFNLVSFIASPNDVFKKDITLQTLAVTVVQIGLFDLFQSKDGRPDYLMGCSLGDIARTYCAGAVDFDVVVEGSWNYHLSAKSIEGGLYHVKSLEGSLTEEMIQEIQAQNLYYAVHQTPQHFLVAGSYENLEKWRALESEIKRYRINPLYDKPLHSPMMNSTTENIHNLYSHTLKSADQWKFKMVSSTHLKVLNTKEDLLADMTDNFNSTVLWMQAVQFATHELAVTRFVNVGPGNTLLLFAERTPVNRPIELVNFLAENAQKTATQA